MQGARANIQRRAPWNYRYLSDFIWMEMMQLKKKHFPGAALNHGHHLGVMLGSEHASYYVLILGCVGTPIHRASQVVVQPPFGWQSRARSSCEY